MLLEGTQKSILSSELKIIAAPVSILDMTWPSRIQAGLQHTSYFPVYYSGYLSRLHLSSTQLVWNAAVVRGVKRINGVFEAHLPGPSLTASKVLSQLNADEWSYSDSLPEISPKYDDSKWLVANKTTTDIPTKPQTLPVLYAEDYGNYH